MNSLVPQLSTLNSQPSTHSRLDPDANCENVMNISVPIGVHLSRDCGDPRLNSFRVIRVFRGPNSAPGPVPQPSTLNHQPGVCSSLNSQPLKTVSASPTAPMTRY